MKLAALALTLTLTGSLLAQQTFTDPANLRGERVAPLNGHELPIDRGALGLQQLLRKLNTRASLLLITAHPDDEDGGMLTLYGRGLGARVATLTLNRGEGGQDAVTGDFEDALGLLRTQELLSADRYFGASQMFGTEVDFGFSKTKEEAFNKWGHQRVLYDAVRAIRLYRPLVIAAVFIGGVTDGHGQHQVSGEIAQEAFKAAADPTVFPELTAEGILPWQALKVYARVPTQAITAKGLFDYATNQFTPARFVNYVTGAVTTTIPSVDVVVHEGATDPLLTLAAASHADLTSSFLAAVQPGVPLSYVQFARIGLGLQKTQIGPGMRLPPTGAFDIGYHLYGSVLCNAPASARPPSITPQICHPERSEGPASRAAGILSSRPEAARFAAVAERPLYSPPSAPPQPTVDGPKFFTGIDTSVSGIASLAPTAFPPDLLPNISRAIETATARFDPSHPSAIAPQLASALKNTDQLIHHIEDLQGDPTQKANALHELRIKRVQLNDALTLALGLSVDAVALSSDLVEDTSPELKTSLTKSFNEPIKLDRLQIDGSGQTPIQTSQSAAAPAPSTPLEHLWHLPASDITPITKPYFYRDNIEQAFYDLRDPALRNAPETPFPLTAWASVDYQGTTITLGRIVHDGPQPVSIVPPFSIASSPRAAVFPLDQTTAELTATLRTTSSTPANINVQSPHNWTIEAKASASAATPTDHPIDFFIHPTAPFSGPQIFQVTAQTPEHHTYTQGFRAVGYPGLIYTNYYTPTTTRVVPVDLKLPEHHNIAYLPGTGDAVPQALASIGLKPTMLTVADLTPANLAQYDTVILGVRTYNAHPDLHGAPSQALLDYASNGGNVLVQYQSAEFTAADAPYPLTLGRDAEKVVDETAPVELLDPGSPLLTIPNKITPADFNGWVEERGHDFLRTWDPRYTALTETHDPGGPETAPQLPQRGGLITTRLGKGRWTYCAFALYRQLPEAVPGAYRIFVDLISPTNPAP